MTTYIADSAHYTEVLSRIVQVRRTLWIGTADIKDLYMDLPASLSNKRVPVRSRVGALSSQREQTMPLLGVLARLIESGVEMRLIHAKEPGPNFREDFDKYPSLFSGLERVLCPRVHFKLLVFDGQIAYIGSANLTGAGIGMKGQHKRNFEAGILTDESALVEAAMTQFDKVWMGAHCKSCLRRDYCGDPIK